LYFSIRNAITSDSSEINLLVRDYDLVTFGQIETTEEDIIEIKRIYPYLGNGKPRRKNHRVFSYFKQK
jgi:hypothetical protein